MKDFDLDKLRTLRDLASIPSNDGEQFIHVDLNLVWGTAGTIHYGFNWKCDMGEIDFRSLDEAIQHVRRLRERASPASVGV